MKQALYRLAALTAAGLGLSASAIASGVYHRVAILMGEQETPPVATSAIGAGDFIIDTCANTVTYYITYSCLSAPETAAHFHGFAPPGVAAGVIQPLPLGNVKTGVWVYAEADETAILNGRVYVNVHSTAFPGGEIRGQMVSHVAYMDGAQENPPTPSAGRGFGLFNVNTVNDTMEYYVSYGGLGAPETAAHFHGPARHGINAGVVFPLALGSPKVGTWAYPPAMESAILDGMTYVNVHTTAFPGGEIRGQITSFVSCMDGRQETPALAVPSSGVGLYSLNRATDELGFDIRHCGLTAAETAAHIHGFAPRGVAAGVLFPLPAGPRKLGFWAYGAANEAALLDSRTYANVHSAANPGGEVRGQIDFIFTECPGDVNCDGTVDLGDLTQLLSNFGLTGGKSAGDINGDGLIDLTDLTLLLSAFGTTC
jgi:hypothetical protein